MCDRLPKFAAFDVAGIKHGSGSAALERSLVARQIQIGLFLVRVVALRAIGFDQWKNVVLIGDLVLGEAGKREQQSNEDAESLWDSAAT
jgi:hypothetical protein